MEYPLPKFADRVSELLPAAPLLATEDRGEYEDIYKAFKREIKPRGVIEQMYFEDFVHLTWEILRLRRCKVAIINLNIYDAFCKVVGRTFTFDDFDDAFRAWLVDPEVKKQVSEILAESQLDESAVEAEAMRLSLDDVERFERLLAVQELRRDKALRIIGEYQIAFAEKLRQNSERIIDGPYKELAYTRSKSLQPENGE